MTTQVISLVRLALAAAVLLVVRYLRSTVSVVRNFVQVCSMNRASVRYHLPGDLRREAPLSRLVGYRRMREPPRAAVGARAAKWRFIRSAIIPDVELPCFA